MMQKKNSDKKKEKVEELARQIYKIYAGRFTTNMESDRAVAKFILANYTRKY